jgi:hypothetical protein
MVRWKNFVKNLSWPTEVLSRRIAGGTENNLNKRQDNWCQASIKTYTLLVQVWSVTGTEILNSAGLVRRSCVCR